MQNYSAVAHRLHVALKEELEGRLCSTQEQNKVKIIITIVNKATVMLECISFKFKVGPNPQCTHFPEESGTDSSTKAVFSLCLFFSEHTCRSVGHMSATLLFHADVIFLAKSDRDVQFALESFEWQG